MGQGISGGASPREDSHSGKGSAVMWRWKRSFALTWECYVSGMFVMMCVWVVFSFVKLFFLLFVCACLCLGVSFDI